MEQKKDKILSFILCFVGYNERDDIGDKEISKYPTTYEDLVALENVPVVVINQESIFTFINQAFTQEYGWTEEDLLGKPVMEIMPAHMRNAHMVGFSRYLTTGKSEILGKPLPLSVVYRDGKEFLSTHYILGRKSKGRWEFAAIIDYPEDGR